MEKQNSNSGCDNDKGKKKKEPGKRCVVMFCNKTNSDGVTMHQFPTDEKFLRQWISFVRQKREPDSWRPGSGHICSDHFMPEDYHGYGLKRAGFATKMLLKKDAIPSRQVIPTPEQLAAARNKKRKLPDSEERSELASPEQYTTPKRPSRALSKLTASRVCTLSAWMRDILNTDFACFSRVIFLLSTTLQRAFILYSCNFFGSLWKNSRLPMR